MMKRPLVVLIVSMWPLILSCGGARKNLVAESQPLRIPSFLIVEKEISGRIFGTTLREPVGLAARDRGGLVVVDAGNHRIIHFDANLEPVADKGGFGSVAGLLNSPSYVTFDNDLSLLVTDEGNKRVVRYDHYLNYADEISFYDNDDLTRFGTASGSALTRYGEAWIADREKNRLAIFDNVGQFDRFTGDYDASGGQLESPEKIIALDDRGFLVCDAGNARLVFYDSYGNFDYEITSDQFEYPASATISGRHLWVADKEANRILCLRPDGLLLFVVGPSLYGTNVPIKSPGDIIVLHDGRLVISDSGNDRLLICRVEFESE